jgi:hypothetical protein
MHYVKGMVQVAGITYRITRVASGQYEVVRILDNRRVGTFSTEAKLRVTSHEVEWFIMMEVALSAVREGRTTWVGPPLALRT